MDKKWFKDEINKIEVPQTDVRHAIQKGIENVQNENKNKKTRKPLFITIIASILLLSFFSSGFFSKKMNGVLAETPLIGKFYAEFYDTVGQDLAFNNMVTKVNKEAISNGIHVVVDSVYYDGGRIGITFQVNDYLVENDDFYFDYIIEDDSDQWRYTSTSNGIVSSDGIIGILRINYPEKHLPQNKNLSFRITAINDIQGSWNFNIPIQQLNNKNLQLENSSFSLNDEHGIEFESITIGKASGVLDYNAIHPLVGEEDYIWINNVTDNKGRAIKVLTTGIKFGKKVVDGRIESEERTLIESIHEDTEYLMINAVAEEMEKQKFHPLSDITPFVIKSNRSSLKLKVTNIEQKNQQLFVTYTLENVDETKSFTELKNFGENLNIVESSWIGDEIVPLGYIVKGNNVEVLDKENYTFKSTFRLDGPEYLPEATLENFSLENYSLEVPFSIALPYKKIPPIKIEIK